MEKTTKPTETRSNTPVSQRAFVTGSSYGAGRHPAERVSREKSQSGEWADSLALEYQRKLAGQQENGNRTSEYGSGQSNGQGIQDVRRQRYGSGSGGGQGGGQQAGRNGALRQNNGSGRPGQPSQGTGAGSQGMGAVPQGYGGNRGGRQYGQGGRSGQDQSRGQGYPGGSDRPYGGEDYRGGSAYGQEGQAAGRRAYGQRSQEPGDRAYSQGSQTAGGSRAYGQEGQRPGRRAYDGQTESRNASSDYDTRSGERRARSQGSRNAERGSYSRENRAGAGNAYGRQEQRSNQPRGVGDRRNLSEQRRQPAGGQQRQAVRAAKPPAGKKPGAGARNFLVQGSILAVAGIIVRLIGMVYRIPLARKIGDNGNGYYNAAYSVYSILLIMSSYSLPTAVSKMISARLAKGQYRNSTRIFKAAMFYATVAGMAGFCALWFGADYFATSVIKMPYSAYALKALAPTIWIMAYLGVLRGFFQGHSTMIPTAISQIFEQVVNAVVSIAAASILFDLGVKSNLVFGDTEFSYAFGAAGGAIGTGAGALTALLFFLVLALGYRSTMKKQARRDRGGRPESYRAISGALFATIVPIIISSAIYNVSNVVDNSLFGHVMEDLGESSLTASHWGVYMGRYHLLFNIPVAIANSLSSSLIPSLSRAVAEKNRRQIHSRIASAIRFSMIIAIPSAVGLTVLAGPVSNLLFSGMDNTMLIEMMALGSSAVVFFSLSTVSNAILQGINRMNVPIINSAVSLAIHVGILYVMLRYLHMGIYSVVYANILFAALVCILNGISIATYARYRQEMVKTFLIPALASAVMGGAAWGIHKLCNKALGNAVSTAAAIFGAVIVYFVVLILMRGVNEQELRSMPGGTRLAAVAKKMHLM